jgi:adenylate cyclase
MVVVVAALATWYFHFRPSPMEVASEEKMAFPLPEKPSIAVLPFDNLTGDPQQEYFSDGMTEEIITGLSKVPYLFVIARNSTFSYKGKPVKIHQVAEELGVRYVLEGSVRRAGDLVRVTAQLIDAIKGHHLWAERYDRDLKDIFALQDEITMKIIEALEVRLTEGEQARMRRKGTDELEAYIKTLHGVAYLRQFNKDGNILARQMGKQAIALDPEYARPYVVLGWTHLLDIFYGSTKSPKKSMERAMELVQKSISLDEFEPCSRDLLSYIYLLEGQHERAIAEAERGITLDPNMADSQMHLAMALSFAGRPEEAIALLKKAIRLNPFAPTNYWHNLGRAYRLAGRHEEAIKAYKKALKRGPDNLLAHVGLAATYSLSGQEDEAQAEAKQVLRVQPKFSVERFAKKLPFKDRSETER